MILPTGTTVAVADGETFRLFHNTGVKPGMHQRTPNSRGNSMVPSRLSLFRNAAVAAAKSSSTSRLPSGLAEPV